MTYAGYASYAYDDAGYYGYGYGYGESDAGSGGINALNDLAGPNSSAYERTYAPTAGVQTSYATEDAAGNVYYRETSYTTSGGYTYQTGSFDSPGGYFGSNYYGSRSNYFSDTNEPKSGTGGYGNYTAGDQAPPLYAESLLEGPGSSSYASASSSQFGTTAAYSTENANGGTYQHVTLSYYSAGASHYYTDSSYTNTSGESHTDESTYAQNGPAYHSYDHSYTTQEYTSKYHMTTDDGSLSTRQYDVYSSSAYRNGSYGSSEIDVSGSYEDGSETASDIYRHSTYTNPYGVTYQSGNYGAP